MYKSFIIKLSALAAALSIICSCAAVRENVRGPFLKTEDMPDAGVFLPAPPALGSAQFYSDSCIYEQSKALRDTPRGEMAIADRSTSPIYFAKIFSEPFGYEISQEATPEIFLLIKRVIPTVRQAVSGAKSKYMRLRPFVQFDEPSATPQDDKGMRGTGSYPSGHSTRGWALALVLSEINPAAQDALLIRGYEYGESRVILGVHYESDVEAARLSASASVVRMHQDEGFLRQLERAKKEFARISKGK